MCPMDAEQESPMWPFLITGLARFARSVTDVAAIKAFLEFFEKKIVCCTTGSSLMSCPNIDLS